MKISPHRLRSYIHDRGEDENASEFVVDLLLNLFTLMYSYVHVRLSAMPPQNLTENLYVLTFFIFFVIVNP